jgi:VanZ family protein
MALLLLISQLSVMSYFAVKPALASMPFSHSDKVLHFLAYFTLMIWPFILINSRSIFLLAAGSAVVYGIIIELLQATLPNRYCSIADMAANLSGVIAFIAIAESRIMQQAKQWLQD